jgi:N-acetylmuramic acid 6-phosphate (MurNAc-6-P) etherase
MTLRRKPRRAPSLVDREHMLRLTREALRRDPDVLIYRGAGGAERMAMLDHSRCAR